MYPSQHCAVVDLRRNPSVSLWNLCGVSKAQSSVDYAMLEYCIREDLKMKQSPYDGGLGSDQAGDRQIIRKDQIEYLDVPNNQENPEMGTRKVPFGQRTLY